MKDKKCWEKERKMDLAFKSIKSLFMKAST